ncbi:MAG: hypothetical protein J6D34_08510 [Atopobiaceae bacterium]|nr:hypothetical protein [Atopobiaceae bacterium]
MRLSITLGVLVCIVGALATMVAGACLPARVVLRSLPKRIKELTAEHPDPPVWRQALGYAGLVAWALVMLCAIAVTIRDARASGSGFMELLMRLLVIFGMWKATDIILLDWLLVSRVHFFARFFPEMRGHEELVAFGFNRAEQIRHTIGAIACCVAIAWIFSR